MMQLRVLLLLAVSCAVFIEVMAQTSQLPVFTVHPESDILAPGDQTTLQCLASSTLSVSYSWLKDGVLISGANSVPYVVTMDPNGEEAGLYSCLATNEAGTTTSRVANVQLAFITENFFSSSPISPHPVTVQEGVTAVISCGPYTSVPSAPLVWEIYDETFPIRINTVDDKAVIGLNNSLYLQDPTVINQVVYECRATNRDSGETLAGFVEVTVTNDGATPSSPVLLSGPKDIMVNEGDDAFFECIVGGRPLANVVWMYPPGANPVVRLEQNNAILRVRAVRPEDEGVYQCTASGVGTFTATLSITDPPVISVPLPTSLLTVVYGSPLALQCGSSQSGEWQWFFNGYSLSDETGPVLEVTDSVLENTGVYQCFISNSAGFDSSVALVEVETIPASITSPLPSTQLAFRQQPFQLTCAADGAPPPNYIWTKESFPLSSNSAFDLSESGVLMILNVDSSSGGNYTCVASNVIAGQEVGSASTSTIVNTIAPTLLITEPGSLYKIRLGTTDTLQCETTYDLSAEVEFTWTKDGQELVIGERISRVSPTVGSIRLEAVEHSDAGVYVCTVTTHYNNLEGPLVQSTPTNLTVIDSPIAPIIISVTTLSSTSLNVQWHFPGSSSILSGYLVQYLQEGGNQLTDWQTSGAQSASATTVRSITELSPDTQYYVRIVAEYVSGTDPQATFSDLVPGRTLVDLPSGPPLEVRVFAVNNTAVRFEWQPPAQPNGEIVDYKIQYRLLRQQNEVEFTTVCVGSGTARTYLLTGLLPLERYEYQISAMTSVGLGPYSEVQTFDTISSITQSPAGPVYMQIWFIFVMVIVVLVVIVIVVLVILLMRYVVKQSKSAQTYSVRTSGYFGNVVADEHSKNTDLTDDAFKAYSTRRSVRGVELTMYNPNNGLDMDTDVESNFIDTQSLPYSTPQLSTSSRTNLVPPGPAPGYINPPTFEEAINRPHSQSMHSTHSRRSSMGEKPPLEYWEEGESKSVLIDEPLSDLEDDHIDKRAMINGFEDYRQMSPRHDPFYTGPGHTGMEYGYDEYDDSDSMGKPSFASEITDATEYSHLQAIGEGGYSHLDTTQTTPNNATFV